MNVRPMTRGDIPRVVELVGLLTRVTDSPGEALERYVARGYAGVVTLVAELDGQVVGTAAVEPRLRWGGKVCTLEDVVADPGYRGRGVARALVAEAVARSRLAGAYAMKLHCSPGLTGLYERCGLRVDGVAMRADL